MRIAFLLPGRSATPAGGFKVVYEYANRLSERGHRVSVVHPWSFAPPRTPRERLRAGLWMAKWRLRPRAIAPWFRFSRRVALPAVVEPLPRRLPAADVLVATAWHTAAAVAAAVPPGAAGAYLIQGYESWDGEEEAVRATWRLPLAKVVVSAWLQEIAAELGEAGRTTRVPLGMDLERLGVDVPPAERPPRIGALYNAGREKRSDDAVAVMEAARQRHPSLSAVMFGTAPRPGALPAWIEYEQLPSAARLRELYNSCAVFVQSSRSEGWGLPACEAMLCGCALATVDNGGSREYARDRETALVTPPGDVEALSAATLELLGDEELRLRLAERGREGLLPFTWERSVEGFERALAAAASGVGVGAAG